MFRRLARRLLRSLVLWAIRGNDAEFSFGSGLSDEDNELYVIFVDGLGIWYRVPRTPDEMREQAWKEIGLADRQEEEAEKREAVDLRW